MKSKFLEIETSVTSKLNKIFSTLNQRRCRKEPVLGLDDECIEEEKKDVSTQFSQIQNIQHSDFPGDHLERYCNILPVLGFNSTKYDINNELLAASRC